MSKGMFMPVSGVRMSENRMTPSGLNACHGCREISTCRCRQGGPPAPSDGNDAQPLPGDARAASVRLAHRSRQRYSRVPAQPQCCVQLSRCQEQLGQHLQGPCSHQQGKAGQGDTTAVSCVRHCRGQDGLCKALTQADSSTAPAQGSMEPSSVAVKSCQAPDPAARLCCHC